MNREILLPCGIALFATLVSLFTYIDSKDKASSIFKDSIKWGILVCLIGNLALTLWLVLDDNDAKKRDSGTQERRHINTMDTLLLTLAKSDSLLDSLRVVKNITIAINDSLRNELSAVRIVDSTTQQLIGKNKEIMTSQTKIQEASNRILNPLFPLHLEVRFEIQANSPLAANLKKLITPRKTPFRGSNSILFLPWQDSIIDGFDIYLIENPIARLSTITNSISQFNFSIWNADIIHKELDYFYEDSTFYFELIYKIKTFRTNPVEFSTTNLGFSDLEHCYIGVRPNPSLIDYKLTYVQLRSLKGLRQSYIVWFTNNKGVIDDCSFEVESPEYARIFIQKIVSKQSDTPPKRRRFTPSIN